MKNDKGNSQLSSRHIALLACVMATGFLIVGQIYLVIPLIGDIAARFAVAPAQAALVGSAFGFAYAAGFLVFGPLSDRLGRKRVLVWGLVATAAATLLVALVPGFGLLLAARALQGFAAATFPPAALSLVSEELPPPQRPFGISLISFAFLGAAPLAQFLAAQAGGGLAAIMLALAPLYLLAALGLAVTISGAQGPAAAQGKPPVAAPGSMLRDLGMLAAWAAAGTVLFGFVFFHSGAQALGPALGTDPQTLRLAGLPLLLLAFAAAPLTRRHGAITTACAGLVLITVAFGLALAGVGDLLLAASAVLSAGVALAVPGLIATVAGRAHATQRGLALAIYSFVLFLGASVAPPVALSMLGQGVPSLWLLPAALSALAALALAPRAVK